MSPYFRSTYVSLPNLGLRFSLPPILTMMHKFFTRRLLDETAESLGGLCMTFSSDSSNRINTVFKLQLLTIIAFDAQ